MPFARPSPVRASPATSSADTDNNANSDNTLATPWDFDTHARQLEAMRVEASTPSSFPSAVVSSSAGSFNAPPSIERTSVLTPGKGFCNDGNVPLAFAGPPAGSAGSTGKPLSLKQRLFQASDTESENENEEDSSDRAQSQVLSRLRASRNDPIRRSISAISGVTVIGKGHSRDREGSASTIGSLRSLKSNGNSEQVSSGVLLTPVRDDAVTLSESSSRSSKAASVRRTPVLDAPSAEALEFQNALNLLEQYPRSSHSPIRTNQARSISKGLHAFEFGSRDIPYVSAQSHNNGQKPSLFTGVAVPFHPDSSQSAQSISLPSLSGSASSSSSTSPIPSPRKHPPLQNNHIHEQLANLLPVLPSDDVNHVLSSLGDAVGPLTSSSISVANKRQEARFTARVARKPSFGNFSFDNLASPSASQLSLGSMSPSYRRSRSRRSSVAGDDAKEANNNHTSLSASQSGSQFDLSHIMRSFSQKGRRSPVRQTTGGLVTNADAFPSGEVAYVDTLGRSSRSSTANANLKSIIQQKRRQASAPFSTSASVSDSLSPSEATSPVLLSRPHSPNSLEKQPWDATPPRRLRSRRNSAAGLASLSSHTTAFTEMSFLSGFEEARTKAMRGMGEVVMTPSIEVMSVANAYFHG